MCVCVCVCVGGGGGGGGGGRTGFISVTSASHFTRTHMANIEGLEHDSQEEVMDDLSVHNHGKTLCSHFLSAGGHTQINSLSTMSSTLGTMFLVFWQTPSMKSSLYLTVFSTAMSSCDPYYLL